MAWRCSGAIQMTTIVFVVAASYCLTLFFFPETGGTNLELVENLFREGIIKSKRVFEAMKAVDR